MTPPPCISTCETAVVVHTHAQKLPVTFDVIVECINCQRLFARRDHVSAFLLAPTIQILDHQRTRTGGTAA